MSRHLTPADRIRHGWRLRLGILVPSGNTVAEPDIPAMLPDGVTFHVTRLKLVGSTREELLGMTDKVEEGAALLADAGVDLVVFHCTGVTMFDPDMEGKLKARIERASGRPATATSEAILNAFARLEVKRVVMVTPYVAMINQREVAFMAHHGITVLSETGLGIADARGMAAVEPGDWYRQVVAHRDDSTDAYFLSCTNIRSVPVIAALERDLGKPVVTSNQAMVWNSLRRGGVKDPVAGFGRLLAEF